MTTRSFRSALLVSMVALVLGACSGTTTIVERTITAPAVTVTAVDTLDATPESEEPTTPAPGDDAAARKGDAATNKVCGLLSVEEVQELSGYTVGVVEGLPVGFRGDLGCIWRLVPVDYGAPSLLISWDQSVGDAAAQADLLRSLIKDGQRKEVKGYGDVATQDGSYLNIVSGRATLSVSYKVRQTSSDADTAVNLAFLKLVYPRTGLT